MTGEYSKKIFLASPIGKEGTDERKRADRVLSFLIRPALLTLGNRISIVRADQIGKPGRVTTQLIQQLRDAEVVIADLTSLNGNVLYELGLRQAQLKPYILIAEKGTVLPFDLQDMRTVFYELELETIDAARNQVAEHVRAALSGEIEPLDQMLFGSANRVAESVDKSTTDLIVNTLADIVAVGRATKSMIAEMSKEIQRTLSSRSSGSYTYIDGEQLAFSELIAATLRARTHVRSTRFFSSAIYGKQPEYAAAIARRVLGDDELDPLDHYSRIIQANNPDKLKDIEHYLHEFSGRPFTFYLTSHPNNFELVIIDDVEVFIHFHAKEAVIGSTLHIFGKSVARKFIDMFDRLHDPNVYAGVQKFDCKYVKTKEDVGEHFEKAQAFFEDARKTGSSP